MMKQGIGIAIFASLFACPSAGLFAALKRHGLKDEKQVPHATYERNTLAVEGALANLIFADHRPRAIVMVGVYAPCAKFIRLAHESGFDPLFDLFFSSFGKVRNR